MPLAQSEVPVVGYIVAEYGLKVHRVEFVRYPDGQMWRSEGGVYYQMCKDRFGRVFETDFTNIRDKESAYRRVKRIIADWQAELDILDNEI